ncbi:MAG: ABC transporter permease [Deltaproteobacteria bacterium]|nr:ABC transporter permease [Deltaproteobacteria bacterium]
MDSRAFRRFRRNKGALAGLVLVVAVTVLGLLGPWLAPYDPVEQFMDALLLGNGLPAGPGVEPGHWLGGDILARDELSRLLSGARVSMLVAYLATALAVLIGVTLGLVSGYVGGRVDTLLMRMVDVVLSMPFLLIAIVMQRVWDAPGIWTICVVLGVLSWTTLARVTRAKTMEARELDYVLAARALGLRHIRILARHVLPNVIGPIIAIATISYGELGLDAQRQPVTAARCASADTLPRRADQHGGVWIQPLWRRAARCVRPQGLNGAAPPGGWHPPPPSS